ncbi:hypothetical protein [Paracoccus saliphilus]|uniref:Uncharacterized protein n=1 Tax=Paracoccus saliphilus TaxID=405559 RepID=A0AA45W6L3_9RHOB|nr:hypothetical protein [Paracoccus saliphilus]WCR02917.1 hypothetical protein JHX88_19235 [Paracoccus saliphilus]SIT02987.1 hypothetical protein SAMN05421772_11313 [Paracoccus saliphilus]
MSKPYAGTPAAKLIADHVHYLKHRKTQSDIAVESGFRNSNFVSMLKSGANNVPICRAPGLARALEVDPALLMRLSLEQSIGPAAAKAVLSVFRTPVSKNELLWLNEIRDSSDHNDPHMTAKGRATIRGISENARGYFHVTSHPASIGKWEDLTANERDWIVFIWIISCGQDPAVNPDRVRRLRTLQMIRTCDRAKWSPEIRARAMRAGKLWLAVAGGTTGTEGPPNPQLCKSGKRATWALPMTIDSNRDPAMDSVRSSHSSGRDSPGSPHPFSGTLIWSSSFLSHQAADI